MLDNVSDMQLDRQPLSILRSLRLPEVEDLILNHNPTQVETVLAAAPKLIRLNGIVIDQEHSRKLH